MGKKSNNIITTKESIRLASNQLERHILRNNHQQIHQLLQAALHNISHQTYSHAQDLIRQTKKQAVLLPLTPPSLHQNIRQQLQSEERLQGQFQEQLQKSSSSYQRTSQIFRKVSLKQKYKHLLKKQTDDQNQSSSQVELSSEEGKALIRLKQLYKRYKVSNMFKSTVIERVSRKLVESLIRKGWMAQHQDILSLTS